MSINTFYQQYVIHVSYWQVLTGQILFNVKLTLHTETLVVY